LAKVRASIVQRKINLLGPSDSAELDLLLLPHDVKEKIVFLDQNAKTIDFTHKRCDEMHEMQNWKIAISLFQSEPICDGSLILRTVSSSTQVRNAQISNFANFSPTVGERLH
jgi:hypothetical protein